MKIILSALLLASTKMAYSQSKSWKERSNHIITVGITNSMFWNNTRGINDVDNYSKKQFTPGLEFISYLYSLEINTKLEVKIGYTQYSNIRNFISYAGSSRLYGSGNPHFSFLLDFKPFRHNDLIIEGGLKLSYFPYKNEWMDFKEATELTPAVTMSETTIPGINPMITFGLGKKCTLFKKYRLDWLFTYNHGTKSLRSYHFIRHTPRIESNLQTYNHHLTLTLRYYLKKYKSDSQ